MVAILSSLSMPPEKINITHEPFLLNYIKHDYTNLESSLESHPSCLLANIKHYIPLYQLYFSLNLSNYNSISLNHKYVLDHLHVDVDKEGDLLDSHLIERNKFHATLRPSCASSTERIKKEIFLKFSPLIDPVKYMINKYKSFDKETLLSIPSLDMAHKEEYKNLISYETNNTPYTDGFFTFLSSVLLNEHNFLNGIDYYGSCTGRKKEFEYNIVDEIDYLNDSEYFHENLGNLFTFRNKDHQDIFNVDSRKNKTKLKINSHHYSMNNTMTDDINELDDILITTLDSTPTREEEKENTLDIEELTVENLTAFTELSSSQDKSRHSLPLSASSHSSCTSSVSSKSSNTTEDSVRSSNHSGRSYHDDKDAEDDGEATEYSTCSSSNSTEDTEEEIMCTLFDFPVEAIFMEKCDNTLDYLMENNMLSHEEWKSCLFQVISILTVYQKCFDFTHNDLHTNNIMFINTDKAYLYYKINGTVYKVPTYGRIYKLIDFGRAIYKYRGRLICSNSFHERGDAGSQYNFGPYYNDEKEEVLPNKSFDLCRLACCLYDYFMDDEEDKNISDVTPLVHMVTSWLIDDKGRNILYKSNGEERYPEFKLYKMIARTIHSAVPENQLVNNIFDEFHMTRANKDKLKNKEKKIINVDAFPVYV